MTNEVGQRLNDTTAQVCRDLGIPYDPYSSSVDPRAQIIFNALLWVTDYVEAQYKSVLSNVERAGQVFKDELDTQDQSRG